MPSRLLFESSYEFSSQSYKKILPGKTLKSSKTWRDCNSNSTQTSSSNKNKFLCFNGTDRSQTVSLIITFMINQAAYLWFHPHSIFCNKRKEARFNETLQLGAAIKFRKDRLTGKCFRALLTNLDDGNKAGNKMLYLMVEESEIQKRSRMYSVFSAWKFYSKERSLLKKYLF